MSLASLPLALASPERPAVDPVVALAAEENRLLKLATTARTSAEKMLFALPNRVLGSRASEVDHPVPAIAEGFRRAHFYEDAAGELFDQIEETRATTIAGVIAQLEYTLPDSMVEIAIASLQDIRARGGVA
jgi:hypothetical protein